MIQFNIGGQFLDLSANINLQFTRKNILFAFDDIETNRSASFDVPATPKNNRIFELANDPARYGEKGRMRIEAQMQYSGGVENGYLYVTSCDRDKYTCCFIFGELLILKQIKEAGKLKEFLNEQDYWQDNITFSSMYAKSAEGVEARNHEFDIIAYCNGYQNPNQEDPISYRPMYCPLPSINIALLIKGALYSAFGVTLNIPDSMKLYRLTIPKPLLSPTIDEGGNVVQNEAQIGDVVYLWDNLPDVTLIDLIKAFAMITHTMILYDENTKTMSFVEDLDGMEDLRDIINIGEVKRTFGNYAQKNYVQTAAQNDDYEEKFIVLYGVDNANIEEEKTISEIGFMYLTGRTNAESGVKFWREALIEDEVLVYDSGTEGVGQAHLEYPNDVGAVFTCYDDSTSYYGGWFWFKKNETIETLCGLATSIKVQALMPLYKFLRLQERKRLRVRGQVYVWTSAQWQDGVVTLELSKTPPPP